MTQDIIRRPTTALAPAGYARRVKVPAAPDAERSRGTAARAASAATRKAYSSDWRIFEQWCLDHGRQPLPASDETLCQFNLARVDGGCSIRTVQRGITSIRVKHQLAKVDDPFTTYARTHWHGLLKDNAKRPDGGRAVKAAPLTLDNMRAIAAHLSSRQLRNIRDKAILLLGFAHGLRQSEIVGIRVSDLQFSERGVVVDIRKSKTDQGGHGRLNAIAYTHTATCPVTALRAWLLASRITDGFVFQTMRGRRRLTGNPVVSWRVCEMIQKLTLELGIVPQRRGSRFSGHSLRRGFVTLAKQRGIDKEKARSLTGHSNDMQYDQYGEQDVWQRCITEEMGI